jgi:hypothetical protein
MKEEEHTTLVCEKGWSPLTHFINILVGVFSGVCFLLSATMWFSCSDPEAMAQVISSLLLE